MLVLYCSSAAELGVSLQLRTIRRRPSGTLPSHDSPPVPAMTMPLHVQTGIDTG